MRAIWKGSISFGLVNIPIGLYPATHREDFKFRLLREGDLSPVNYKRVAEADGKEVPWEKIVKGYEYAKGKFVVIKEEDFKRVDVEATQTVDIINFVEVNEINPMFFDKPYYLVPEKSGGKAYALLREALRKTGKVGIAKVVIKSRQHLAAVKPQDNAIVLELMHFADEISEHAHLNIPSTAVGKKELDMAESLVDSMTDKWKPEQYGDDYKDALLKMIKQKAKTGEAPEAPAPAASKKSNVIDLVSVLQQSLNQTGKKPSRKPSKSAKKSSRAHATKRKAA
ncbi:MAG: Ku domainn containing protein [Verrucomicrobiales bacterium]|jgi:DNA end-binding protein Ku|nr:Ku domainn containing protein [Verrucomicrobiales bacterium]